MVTCIECLGKLPNNCTCDITPTEKMKRWIEAAEREIDLIEYIEKGNKPKIKIQLMIPTRDDSPIIRLQSIEPEIKTEITNDYNTAVKAITQITPNTIGIIATLLDTFSIPLYRRIIILPKQEKETTIEIKWNLGFDTETVAVGTTTHSTPQQRHPTTTKTYSHCGKGEETCQY